MAEDRFIPASAKVPCFCSGQAFILNSQSLPYKAIRLVASINSRNSFWKRAAFA